MSVRLVAIVVRLQWVCMIILQQEECSEVCGLDKVFWNVIEALEFQKSYVQFSDIEFEEMKSEPMNL